MIFRRRTHQRRPADIDIFDRFVERNAGARNGLLERVEVHHHHVDRFEAMTFHLALMGQIGALREDAAVDLRMQRLHASTENFRKIGEVLD